MPKLIIGIDEAGRGPLAGSVYAAAAIVPKKLHRLFKSKGITDSKKLTEKDRFELYELIKSKDVIYAYAKRDCTFIDEHDILIATFESMKEACLAIEDQFKDEDFEIQVDGKLKIRDFKYDTTPIIKGDSKILEISVASIVAKCEKDLEAMRMGEEFPNYGFENHKGYGTKSHMDAIKQFGPCKYHRQSFAPIKETTFSETYRELKEKITAGDDSTIAQIQMERSFNMHDLCEDEIAFLQKLIKKRSVKK